MKLKHYSAFSYLLTFTFFLQMIGMLVSNLNSVATVMAIIQDITTTTIQEHAKHFPILDAVETTTISYIGIFAG